MSNNSPSMITDDHHDILATLEPSISPTTSIPSDVLELTLPTIVNPPHPILTQCEITSSSNLNQTQNLTSTQVLELPLSLKNPRTQTPPDLHITIDNDVTPIKKKYDMLQDPRFIDSGLMPPVLHPLKNPSKLNTVSGEFITSHPKFKANFPALYMTRTSYLFQLPHDCSLDQYVSYASRQLSQLNFWQSKKLKFFYLQFNFLKPTQADISTNPLILFLLQLKKSTTKHIKPSSIINILSNFIFQNHKYTSPFTFHSHYQIDYNATVGTLQKL